jgi:hypothetical protein
MAFKSFNLRCIRVPVAGIINPGLVGILNIYYSRKTLSLDSLMEGVQEQRGGAESLRIVSRWIVDGVAKGGSIAICPRARHRRLIFTQILLIRNLILSSTTRSQDF